MRLLPQGATLSPAKCRLGARTLGALWAFRLALWMVPLPVIRRFLEKRSSRAFGSPRRRKSSTSPAQIGGAIGVASPWVPRSTCLVRALAAQWLLARENRSSQLHIGVIRQADGQFAAHAWVECEGVIIVGGARQNYTPILRWESGL